ncbi:crossover junction endodeoxyribonuclease RuvC [Bathymodiolus septemdierum thioautotrophic gill symbiont]|uniref:Crossover junction endodeoxyribonuclease RuvC n=1 Tax=endosymbiont of Bathymodiolus septemdierum str. Myojin knoll TaxID=1303921 RepID=A0A0P0US13_9GAMM|nr:crossover junction endodeoxyribonuclease RuvC [Bathymodiolus septemdierum thioautotrophic gill symbiont]BAS68056.1 crossover junction endodeoxyribonuclease RuvC [endosymbiont of Bathymodiolus septemdierum str. Myojin knoll]
MKILGVDPGSRITGFGIINAEKLKFTYIASGCIRTKGALTDRITTIFEGISEVVEKYQPDIVVIERAFMRPDRPNPDAAIKLGHARGAIISAVGSRGIKMVEYSPNQIKKAIVGKGHAAKDQVSYMVCESLKLNKAPQEDAADALAGAICHAYHCL